MAGKCVPRGAACVLLLVPLLGVGCSGEDRGRVSSAETDPAIAESERAGAGDEQAAAGSPAPAGIPPAGAVSARVSEVVLSPRAQVYAEKFKCACGCGHYLAECFCQNTPGSIDMKQYLQSLVDQGLTPGEVEEAMVERYGPGVLP